MAAVELFVKALFGNIFKKEATKKCKNNGQDCYTTLIKLLSNECLMPVETMNWKLVASLPSGLWFLSLPSDLL